MALSGSMVTGGVENRTLTFSWTAKQSISDNTSTISWKLYGSGSNTTGWVRVSEVQVIIAGTQVYYVPYDHHIDCYYGTVVASGTYTIPHNSDGTKSFAVSVQAGIYEWSINKSAYASWTLDEIPRTSTISAGTFTMGTAGSITIHKANTNFTHTIYYQWGDTTDTGLSSGKGYKETIATKTTATSVSWTPPLKLANIIPNVITGKGTLFCSTYNGNTLIGSTYIIFNCNVPASIIPTLTKPTVTVINNTNSVLKSWGLYVAGYSQAKIVATATGAYNSTISSFSISSGYSATVKGTSLSYTGSIFTTSGNKSFTVVAKDSRGRSSAAQTTSTITIYTYSEPTISFFAVSRSVSDTQKVIIRANWSYASVNGKNSITPVLYYKKETESGWTIYSGDLTNGVNTVLTDVFDEASSYDFKLIITDALSNNDEQKAHISTAQVLLDFRSGGKGLGIGKICEKDELQVAFNAVFENSVTLQQMRLKDSNKNIYNALDVFDGSEYGIGMRLGAGGSVVVGSGESSQHYIEKKEINGSSESLCLTSDWNLYIAVNCNNIDDYRSVVLNSQGYLFPETKDISIGHTSYHFLNGYFDNLYNSSGSITTSDKRLKTDLTAIPNAVDFTLSLKPYQFKYINGTSKRNHWGFMSQDVKESLDTICNEDCGVYIEEVKNDDPDSESKLLSECTDDEKCLALRYEELIAPIVATIQYQNETINKLQKQIEDLISSK